jgi:hypothetical protein
MDDLGASEWLYLTFLTHTDLMRGKACPDISRQVQGIHVYTSHDKSKNKPQKTYLPNAFQCGPLQLCLLVYNPINTIDISNYIHHKYIYSWRYVNYL